MPLVCLLTTALFFFSSANLHEVEFNINSDLDRISKWSNDWLVTFNPNKTELLTFTNSTCDTNANIFFSNQKLVSSPFHKHLGVVFSSNGKWTNHVEYLFTKCSKMIGILRKFKFSVPRQCLNSMYLSFVRPILEYADVVWSGVTVQQSNKLEQIQHEAARIVTGLTKSVSLERLYKEVGWVSLKERRKEHTLICFFKILQSQSPSYLFDLLPPTVGSSSSYNLRNINSFVPPPCRLECYRNSFFPSAVRLWNVLPDVAKTALSISLFKRTIRTKVSTVPNQFLVGKRKLSILHARLRNKCSNLNHDLYTNYVSQTPSCGCGVANETCFHYFFECTKYATIRELLFQSLTSHNICLDLETLLFGSDNLSQEENSYLFLEVQKYIHTSKRFS